MAAYIHSHMGSFAFLIGILFFLLIANGFNHRTIYKVEDKTVAILAIFIAGLCGVVMGLFTLVMTSLIFNP